MKILRDNLATIMVGSVKNTNELFASVLNGTEGAVDYFNRRINEVKEGGRDVEIFRLIGEFICYNNHTRAHGQNAEFNAQNHNAIKENFMREFDIPLIYMNIAERVNSENYTLVANALPEHYDDDIKYEYLPMIGLNIGKAEKEDVAKRQIKKARINELSEEIDEIERDVGSAGLSGRNMIFDNSFFREYDIKKTRISQRTANEDIEASFLKFTTLNNEVAETVERGKDFDISPFYKNFGKFDDTMGDAIEKNRSRAIEQIAIYKAAKDRKDNRTFLDKFLHLYRTYKEYSAVKAMGNAIKENYGLNDGNLTQLVNLLENPESKDNIGIFRRDNTTLTFNPTAEEINNQVASMGRDKEMNNFEENLERSVDDGLLINNRENNMDVSQSYEMDDPNQSIDQIRI